MTLYEGYNITRQKAKENGDMISYARITERMGKIPIVIGEIILTENAEKEVVLCAGQ